MKTGLQQSSSLRQDLKINPRLYQAMDLLYMPLFDLQEYLKQALLTNPFLDLVEPEDEEDETEAEADAEPSEAEEPDAAESEAPDANAEENGIDWEEILLDGFETGGTPASQEVAEQRELVSVERKDLSDHLMEQLSLLDLTPRQEPLAAEFVGNINDDGYLSCSVEEVRRGMNEAIERAAEQTGAEHEDLPLYTAAEAEEVLAIIQQLDPPGVGARDLRECLLLQLRDQGRDNTLAGRLVRDSFDDLIAHRWAEVARQAGLTEKEVQDAADEIQKLDPKPGLRFSVTEEDYIVPDMIVDRIDGKYRVTLNDGNLPRLRLSRTYQEMARDKSRFQGENREFVASKLNAATWMIQAIEQRRQTMLKVMNCIVDRQRPFLEKGTEYLKPLTLHEVADATGMHESTISRVTNEKWVQTPRGVFPLKFFFSSGITTADGDDVSARWLRAQIEKLIHDEDPQRPLTDQEILDTLQRQGIRIARRTVAKYRDQLGLLSARMRKRV